MTTMTTERCWHLAIQSQASGPYTWAEVEAKIAQGEVSSSTLSWKTGEASWIAMKERAEASEALAAHCKWFVVKNGTQFGPIVVSELKTMISAGQVVSTTLLWSEGMNEWKPLSAIPALSSVPALPAIPQEAKAPAMPPSLAAAPPAFEDHRGASRRPVHARLIVSNDKTVNVASCHDMSEGGMQVLCEEIPGPIGARIKLNVSPESGESFVAKGVIVRIREDRRGYSFRFDELTDGARRAISGAVHRAS